MKTNEVLAPQSGDGNFTDVFFFGGGHKLNLPSTPHKRLQTLRHYISSLAWDIKLSNWEVLQIFRRSFQWCRRSNPEFEISIVRCLGRGASVSHNESECLCFNSRCTNLSRQSTERGRISTPSCHFWRQGRQHSRFLRPLLPAVWLFCVNTVGSREVRIKEMKARNVQTKLTLFKL